MPSLSGDSLFHAWPHGLKIEFKPETDCCHSVLTSVSKLLKYSSITISNFSKTSILHFLFSCAILILISTSGSLIAALLVCFIFLNDLSLHEVNDHDSSVSFFHYYIWTAMHSWKIKQSGKCNQWTVFKFQVIFLYSLSHKFLWKRWEYVSSPTRCRLNNRVDWAF